MTSTSRPGFARRVVATAGVVAIALFGALAATYFSKHWKISIFPIMVGVITLIFASTMGVGTLIFVTIIASLLGAFAMYKFGWLDSKEERKAKKAAKAKK